ncbi:transposase [Nonomuraea sp. NPDC004186]
MTRRHDLADAQWAALEPHLPAASGKGRPKWSRRQLIDGIRWRIRTGAPWRDVPARDGHRFTVYVRCTQPIHWLGKVIQAVETEENGRLGDGAHGEQAICSAATRVLPCLSPGGCGWVANRPRIL